jgi:hypothetical protein
MNELFNNNAESEVASTFGSVATALTVTDGSVFPSPTGDNFFYATLVKIVAGRETEWEIVKCTARSGNTLTVDRAQDNTVSQQWESGDMVSLRVVAASLDEIATKLTYLDGEEYSVNWIGSDPARGLAFPVTNNGYTTVTAVSQDGGTPVDLRFRASSTLLLDAGTSVYVRIGASGSESNVITANANGVFLNQTLRTDDIVEKTGNHGVVIESVTLKDGAVVATGDITAFSDRRLKQDIFPITNAMDKVMHLEGCTFSRIDTGKRQTGLIAQDVQDVLPEAVVENDDGMLSVAYGNLVGLLVQAIKEQQVQIDALIAQGD